jgi:hypothetical protein
MKKENGQSIPHYAMPNKSAEAAMYINHEQDMVRSSFQTGNFRSIASLPTEFRYGYVIEAAANHVDSNITSAIYHAPHGAYKVYGKNKIFQEFKYISSPYNLVENLKRKEGVAQREKEKDVAKKPFLFSSADASLPYFDPDEEAKYADPYDAGKDVKLREAWLQQSKILHGPFYPNTKKALDSQHGNEAALPDMMRLLATLIDQDWEDSEFQIYRDEEDLIVIEFDLESVESEKGLLAYLNNIIATNDELAPYALAKVPELWNHKAGDGSIYYALKPSWVKRARTESYYALHPEKQKFRTRLQALKQFMAEQQNTESNSGKTQ